MDDFSKSIRMLIKALPRRARHLFIGGIDVKRVRVAGRDNPQDVVQVVEDLAEGFLVAPGPSDPAFRAGPAGQRKVSERQKQTGEAQDRRRDSKMVDNCRMAGGA